MLKESPVKTGMTKLSSKKPLELKSSPVKAAREERNKTSKTITGLFARLWAKKLSGKIIILINKNIIPAANEPIVPAKNPSRLFLPLILCFPYLIPNQAARGSPIIRLKNAMMVISF